MFSFERFKLNKQIDSFTKQLGEENSRLDTVQKLLNVGYIEFDMKTNTVFRSDYMLKMTELSADKKTDTLEGAVSLAEGSDELAAIVKEAIAKGGTGEFTYKRKESGKEYRLLYETKDGKMCAVIQPL